MSFVCLSFVSSFVPPFQVSLPLPLDSSAARRQPQATHTPARHAASPHTPPPPNFSDHTTTYHPALADHNNTASKTQCQLPPKTTTAGSTPVAMTEKKKSSTVIRNKRTAQNVQGPIATLQRNHPLPQQHRKEQPNVLASVAKDRSSEDGNAPNMQFVAKPGRNPVHRCCIY